MPKFEVIRGTPKPDSPAERVRKRIRVAKPAEVLECPRCAGREFIEARAGLMFKAGKTTGGTAVWLCVLCLARGERVRVI